MKSMSKLVAQQRRLAGLDGHAPWAGLREDEDQEGEAAKEGPQTSEYTTWLASVVKDLTADLAKDMATRGRGDPAMRQKLTSGIKMALDAAKMLQGSR